MAEAISGKRWDNTLSRGSNTTVSGEKPPVMKVPRLIWLLESRAISVLLTIVGPSTAPRWMRRRVALDRAGRGYGRSRLDHRGAAPAGVKSVAERFLFVGGHGLSFLGAH